MRKIIVYPQSAMKPIVLTDNSNQSISDLKQQVVDVLSGTKISVLETETDVLIVRPSEIQAVLITEKELMDSEDKKGEYERRLNLGGPNGERSKK